MKKTLGAFTLAFGIISLLIIGMNYTGHDDKCIFLIGLNPILNEIVYIEPFRTWLESGIVMRYYLGNPTTLNMYLGHILTLLFYGLILDLIKYGIDKVTDSIYDLIKNKKIN